MELSGRLISFPIAELLHWAHNDRRTGSLVVRSAGREKRIFFREGEIVSCVTDDPSEFYGQFLLLSGYLDQETLYRLLALCRHLGKRLGAVLELEEVLALPDIQRTLRFHIEDVICDIFLWDHGVFFFRGEQPPRQELLAEPIATLGLALEGSHWVDEVGRIRQALVDDHVVLRRTSEEDPEEDLTPRQRRILDEADGVRRLEALYGVIHGSFYRFLVAAHELVEMGHLEIAHRGRRLHVGPRDEGLDDLLWEQAQREQGSERSRVVTLGEMQRYVPVWVRPPADEEWQRMPEAVRAFYRQLDGRRRLRDIFSQDDETWQRELELLELQLGKQALALLPAPVAELQAETAEREGATAILVSGPR